MVLSFADVQSLSIQILFGGKRSSVAHFIFQNFYYSLCFRSACEVPTGGWAKIGCTAVNVSISAIVSI
jgi:hypothetical protein